MNYATKVRMVLDKNNKNSILDECSKEFMLGIVIKHPNIIQYKYFTEQMEHDMVCYHIIMELIQGVTLSTFITDVNHHHPIQNIHQL